MGDLDHEPCYLNSETTQYSKSNNKNMMGRDDATVLI